MQDIMLAPVGRPAENNNGVFVWMDLHRICICKLDN